MSKNKNIRTVEDILNLETGVELKASSLINNMDSDDIVMLRRKLRKVNREGHPILVCAECSTKLELRSNKLSRKSRGKDYYFFKHYKDVKECSIKTNSHLPVGVLLARKYENVKESIPHIILKNRLGNIIEQFHSPEKISIDSKFYFDKSGNGDKRKPDVYAIINGREYAFEIQLNTTFLSVIEEREAFYERNGVSIIWIFNNFSLEEQFQRLTQKDIYVPNRLNAFVLDDDILNLSIKYEKLHLKVFYKTFFTDGWRISSEWKNEVITLQDLNYADNYKPFYYDSFADKEKVKQQLARIQDEDRLEQIRIQNIRQIELDQIAKQIQVNKQKRLKCNKLIVTIQLEIDLLHDEQEKLKKDETNLNQRIKTLQSENQEITEKLKDIDEIVEKVYKYFKSCNSQTRIYISNPLDQYFDIYSIKSKYCEQIKTFDKIKTEIKSKIDKEILPRIAFINKMSIRDIGGIKYSVIPIEKEYELFLEKFHKEIKVIDKEDIWASIRIMPDVSLFRWQLKNKNNSKTFLIDMSSRKSEALTQENELTKQLIKISQDENLFVSELKCNIVDLLKIEKDKNLNSIKEFKIRQSEHKDIAFISKKIDILTKRRNLCQQYFNSF